MSQLPPVDYQTDPNGSFTPMDLLPQAEALAGTQEVREEHPDEQRHQRGGDEPQERLAADPVALPPKSEVIFAQTLK